MDISSPSPEKKPKLWNIDQGKESAKNFSGERNSVQNNVDSINHSEHASPNAVTVTNGIISQTSTITSAPIQISFNFEELKNIERSEGSVIIPSSGLVTAQTGSPVTIVTEKYVPFVQPFITSNAQYSNASLNVKCNDLTDIPHYKQTQINGNNISDNICTGKDQLLKSSPLRDILENGTDLAKYNTPGFAIDNSNNTSNSKTETLENDGFPNSTICTDSEQTSCTTVLSCLPDKDVDANIDMRLVSAEIGESKSKCNNVKNVDNHDKDTDDEDLRKLLTGGDHEKHEKSNIETYDKNTKTDDLETSQSAYQKVELFHKDFPTLADSGRRLRKSRRRTSGEVVQCPVCRSQVKISQFLAHYELEVARMEKWRKDYSKKNKKRLSYTSTSTNTKSNAERLNEDDEEPMDHEQRNQAFIAVRQNREKRRKKGANHSRGEGTECPVCNKRIMGNQQEVNRHVNLCLVKEDGDVDIEGSDDNNSDNDNTDQDLSVSEQFEEYEWAGQTRVRVTSMIAGSFAESGFTVGQRCTDDEVGELNIEEDETDIYGESQYNEADLIPCTADEPEEEKERQAIRNVLLQNESHSCSSSQSHESTKWSANQEQPDELLDTGQEQCRLSRSNNIKYLERKIQDLQRELNTKKSEKYKCLICMECYECPVTSIQCWHVYCEECWLRTLGAKKLCPQCNMITHPSDLRKIYL